MSLQKKVEQITSQIDHNSFDSVALYITTSINNEYLL